MKVQHLFGFLILLQIGYMYRSGLQQKFFVKDCQKYIEDYKWLWKPIIMGACTSWLCGTLVLYNRIKACSLHDPVSPMSAGDRPSLPSDLNFITAVSLGPMCTVAYIWEEWS